MPIKERKFYSTFFFHTFWEPFNDENDFFINKRKYNYNSSNDDLGWLKIDSDAYWKSFSVETLGSIIKDYEMLNFDLIKKMYKLDRLHSLKQFENYSDFNTSEYQKETEETFQDFVTLTENIINVYKNCIKNKKDLIIEIG